MRFKYTRRPHALVAGVVALTALCIASVGALQAQAAGSEIAVGSLAIVSGTATGSISGLQPNGQVTIDGNTQQADQSGTVTLTSSPLDGDGKLTIGFTDVQGKQQTVAVDLTDSITGLALTPAQIKDPIANTTKDVRITVADGGPGGTGSGGTGSGGSSSGGSSGGNAAPAGALATPAGTSIPASSVVAGQARLVIASVKFNPTTVRSRTKPIRVELTVKDTRGFLVRDAIVFVRGVPENRVLAVKEARTSQRGVVAFTLKPTKLLPLRAGGRLTVFTRARKAGEPINGGVSTRRLVSLRLAQPR